MGSSICEWGQGMFTGKSIDPELNNLLLVLISKTSNPADFRQFRPISLYSIMYKLVMKVPITLIWFSLTLFRRNKLV